MGCGGALYVLKGYGIVIPKNQITSDIVTYIKNIDEIYAEELWDDAWVGAGGSQYVIVMCEENLRKKYFGSYSGCGGRSLTLGIIVENEEIEDLMEIRKYEGAITDEMLDIAGEFRKCTGWDQEWSWTLFENAC